MNCALALRMLDAHIDDELDRRRPKSPLASRCRVCAAFAQQRTAMRTALRTADRGTGAAGSTEGCHA